MIQKYEDVSKAGTRTVTEKSEDKKDLDTLVELFCNVSMIFDEKYEDILFNSKAEDCNKINKILKYNDSKFMNKVKSVYELHELEDKRSYITLLLNEMAGIEKDVFYLLNKYCKSVV